MLTTEDITGWTWILVMSSTRYAITILAEVILIRGGFQISNTHASAPGIADSMQVQRFGLSAMHYTNLFRELNIDFSDSEQRHEQLGYPQWYTIDGANLPM